MQYKQSVFKKIIKITLLVSILSVSLFAQNRSRISGTVRDASTGNPLYGANVIIPQLGMGAATNEEGQFMVINVPVGTYKVQARMIGYETLILTEVMVSANRMTRVEFDLKQTVIEGQAVEVTAKRHILHKEVSSTQMVVSDNQIQDASGIREINAFLTKLPGVSEENGFLTIRGGSADQTGMMVNGLSYMNAANGNAETSLPMSAIEQVSLLSGGYNAEYGNFRSGLINVTTKSGTKDGYHGTASYSMDQPHIRRFGGSFYDKDCAAISDYVDPEKSMDMWIRAANNFNIAEPEVPATATDYFYLANWMHMTIPDYKGLAGLSDSMKSVIGYYELTDEQKKAFKKHHMEEEYSDWNFDGGFGGPLPFISKKLGDATFYISHNSKERHYIQPISRKSDNLSTTLLTIKAQPLSSLTLTYNGLYKFQKGVSPIRPPWGDFPDASREGGFMPQNNLKFFSRTQNPDYFYNPPFFPKIEQKTWMHGITLNHVLSKNTFWELSLSTMNIQDYSEVGNTRDSTVITHFGPFPVTEMPYGKLQYGNNRVIGIFDGDTLNYNYPSYDALPFVTNRRFRRKEGDLYNDVNTKQYRAKFDISSQIGLAHFMKAGFEYNLIDINHNLWNKWNENYYNVYEYNYHRKPSQTGIYIQDQITLESIVANIGLRVDYYYGGGGQWPVGDPFNTDMFLPQSVPDDTVLFEYLEAGKSYIWDLWEAYDDSVDGNFLKPIKNHLAISPRIGISFPITEKSKFYFNYGHFRSNPPYYAMYLYRYRYDKNGLYDMSNPNLEPPRTISYELGVTYNIWKSLLLKVSGYSKDVTGQHGEVTYINNRLDYDKWVNNEYEDIQGLEINLSKSDNSWLTGWINFNYMLKKSGLTGREEITDVELDDYTEGLYEGQETRALPQPRINGNVTFRTPTKWGWEVAGCHPFSNLSLTLFGEWRAGRYFTANPANIPNVNNNMQWPDYYMVDMKTSKNFKIGPVTASLFLDISNLFNFKVSLMQYGYAFQRDSGDDFEDWQDFLNYIKTLHLEEWDDPVYENFRNEEAGYYIPGNDKIGDLNSKDKPYIDDPNYDFWLFGQPRDMWFGIKFSF